MSLAEGDQIINFFFSFLMLLGPTIGISQLTYGAGSCFCCLRHCRLFRLPA